MKATTRARLDYRNAVWETPDLKPLEKLVALAFEKYAGHGLEHVWVSGTELRHVTGLSRDATSRAIRGLKTKGWLILTEKPRQHRSGRYRLAVPQAYVSRASGDTSVPSPDTSVPSPDTSVPSGRNEQGPEQQHEQFGAIAPHHRDATMTIDDQLDLLDEVLGGMRQREESTALSMLRRGENPTVIANTIWKARADQFWKMREADQ